GGRVPCRGGGLLRERRGGGHRRRPDGLTDRDPCSLVGTRNAGRAVTDARRDRDRTTIRRGGAGDGAVGDPGQGVFDPRRAAGGGRREGDPGRPVLRGPGRGLAGPRGGRPGPGGGVRRVDPRGGDGGRQDRRRGDRPDRRDAV